MRYDVIVIGAGIAGTSIAWHLQKSNLTPAVNPVYINLGDFDYAA
ncbi:FAD-dependent oxidoreductase [uncultured Psychrobacter sp.]